MNNTLLLKNLLLLKQGYKETKCLDWELFEKIIEDTKVLVSMEKIQSPSKRKSLKKSLQYLKKASNYGARPILGYAHRTELLNNETYYVFTNNYTLYALKENNGLPLIEEQDEPVGKYPDVKRLIPNREDGLEVDIVDYKDLINIIKTNPDLLEKNITKSVKTTKNLFRAYIECEDYGKIYLDGNDIKEAFEILASKELKCYVFGSHRPILLTNPEGEFALVLPLKETNQEYACINKK